MNFFEHQDAARKSTGRLVIMFIAAVIVIVIMVYLVVATAGAYWGGEQVSGEGFDTTWYFNPLVMAVAAPATLGVIGLGSLYKVAQLRGGGQIIAERLNGRALDPNTSDLTERRVLNVVEEMAIASGVPVPPVYFLDQESGINAFAAGYSPDDAVIGITRGCAERLTRDELQGVVAHEFSHVLNGDMRLNIRLIGILHGILIIGIIGYFVLRSAMYSGAAYSSSRKRGNPAPLLAIGGALMLIGYAGTFFGNMIKAAVSRQREFLADASAVQFTRNPDGIAGALKRIGGFTKGAEIDNPNAPESRHMFFGEAIVSGLNAVFATHPPLPERIRRIEPRWDGEMLESEPLSRSRLAEHTDRAELRGFAGEAAPSKLAPDVAEEITASSDARMEIIHRLEESRRAERHARIIDQIGQPSEEHIEYAQSLMRRLPPALVEAAHETYSARALIYALLLHRDDDDQQKQLDVLHQHEERLVNNLVARLHALLARIDQSMRLPLIDLALPALKKLSQDQYEAFRTCVDSLVKADEKLSLFEWCLQRILIRHLDPQFRSVPKARTQYYNLSRLGRECSIVLSTLAYAGQDDESQARKVFDIGTRFLNQVEVSLLAKNACGLDEIHHALGELDATAPRVKEQVIGACFACIGADREVTTDEAELMRAIAATLSVPVPPVLPGQRFS